MKRALLSALAVAVALTAAGCKEEDKKAAEANTNALQTEEQKVGYAMGVNLGERLKAQGMPLDVASFSKGIEDVFKGDQRAMTPDEMMKALQDFQQKQLAKMEAEQKALADKNKADSDKFMNENKVKEGVKSTASGLQYRVLKEGTGNKPTADDTVKVHYKGTLPDGQEFDSSYARGEPATFPLRSVIPGWTEGLQLMTEGAKFELVIPSDLAYGPGGTGGVIGPNQALVFEVELLGIEKGEAAAEPHAHSDAEPAKQ